MTKEEFNKAEDVLHDIEVLEKIKETQNNSHWVGFVRAENEKEVLRFYSGELWLNFKTFVSAELDKLKIEFKEM